MPFGGCSFCLSCLCRLRIFCLRFHYDFFSSWGSHGGELSGNRRFTPSTEPLDLVVFLLQLWDVSNSFVENWVGWESTNEGEVCSGVYCRERNETSLRGRRDYPKDLTAGKSERVNRYSASAPRGQRAQRETSQRSRQKTILNPITYLHPCCPTASLVGLYLHRS
jgi:hypothetical protein